MLAFLKAKVSAEQSAQKLNSEPYCQKKKQQNQYGIKNNPGKLLVSVH